MRRAPCAKHHLSFKVAGVHGLGVDKNGRVRTKLARRGDRANPETLEKRRANLDDVGYPSHPRDYAEAFRSVDRNLQQHQTFSCPWRLSAAAVKDLKARSHRCNAD
jgi:hypothetical protein